MGWLEFDFGGMGIYHVKVGLVTIVDGYIPAAASALQGLSNIFLIDECVLLLQPRRVSAIVRGV